MLASAVPVVGEAHQVGAVSSRVDGFVSERGRLLLLEVRRGEALRGERGPELHTARLSLALEQACRRRPGREERPRSRRGLRLGRQRDHAVVGLVAEDEPSASHAGIHLVLHPFEKLLIFSRARAALALLARHGLMRRGVSFLG